MSTDSKTFRILSIDGGGIRGIIPATLLAELEQQTGKPIANQFDLIAGTSTGGILALGLALRDKAGKPKFTAKELVSIYEQHGQTIFKKSRIPLANSGLFEEMYASDGIESVLKQYFGNSRLKDCLPDVIISAYEIERRRPFFFKSKKARESAADDYALWQIARSTSAAPTYFEPSKIDTGVNDFLALIDGGVIANNPSICAYVEAMKAKPKNILLVSIGTGTLEKPIRYSDAKDWGAVSWIKPLIDILMGGGSELADYQADYLFQERKGSRYMRFQTTLHPDNTAMDDASPENVRMLKIAAENMLIDKREDIRELVKLLHKNATTG
jgi:patatin-like phospholipase/acyl hydrolase